MRTNTSPAKTAAILATLSKGLLVCLSLSFLSGTALSAGSHEQTDMAQAIVEYRALTPTEKTVQDVLNVYAQAMAERSIETMEQAVIPGDFSVIESGYANWTWEDFRDKHLAEEFQMLSDPSYKIDLLVGETQGPLGFAVFRYTAAGKVNGREISISGLGTAVLEHTDDGWRIHHMHTSAPRDQLEKAMGSAPHGSSE